MHRIHQPELFDLDAFEHERVAASPWHGAPLAYTTDYHSPDALDAAFKRYKAEHGDFGCIPRSHMWHRALTHPPLEVQGHSLHVFSADARCDLEECDHRAAPLPGTTVTQAICPGCEWHTIRARDSVVVAWHDHALPGWRELPVYDRDVDRSNARSIAALRRWAEREHPADWQFNGAPVITQRSPHSHRAVPGYSPFGGYDISANALDT